ncbi:F-box/LRR-repeat protein At3g59250-like [Corylus avellana]|uniref:F-box/LRR-repeat protein At3g59250-like n=1 Tax=Corylus avellana TaxID=13451 RepID=UPI00286B9DE8|nr:F-box/LRR-repeat protein At3g59250-like [Corylus avellana]
MGDARINLELVFDPGKPFDLPHCVLGCNSLRQLKVDAGDGFVRSPSPYFAATNLQRLELRPVRIEKGCNVNLGKLFSSFKSLKCLWLRKISGVKSITFTCPSLESLLLSNYDDELCNISILQEKLQDLGISWCSKSGGKSLTISAPNLKKFYFGGSAVDYYNCMKDFPHLFPHLFNAEMGLLSFPTHQASSKHIFDKILHSIQRAKCLTINECFVQVLLEQGCLPFLFDNLEHLTVRRSSRGVQVLPLRSLLRGIINLKHLTVSCLTRGFANVTNSMPSREFTCKMGHWESQNVMFTRQLKKVTMELFDREDEVELIKYLLKNAEELEVMEILYTSPVSSDLITEIRKYDQRG